MCLLSGTHCYVAGTSIKTTKYIFLKLHFHIFRNACVITKSTQDTMDNLSSALAHCTQKSHKKFKQTKYKQKTHFQTYIFSRAQPWCFHQLPLSRKQMRQDDAHRDKWNKEFFRFWTQVFLSVCIFKVISTILKESDAYDLCFDRKDSASGNYRMSETESRRTYGAQLPSHYFDRNC